MIHSTVTNTELQVKVEKIFGKKGIFFLQITTAFYTLFISILNLLYHQSEFKCSFLSHYDI